MESDPKVSQALNTAFEAGDVAQFHRLLRKHPDNLRYPDGTDRWMWHAAMIGSVPLLKTLVELGQNVNESKDVLAPEDPFCQLEGPILQASRMGQLEVVKWLLEKGARVNFMFDGKSRCLPLLDAAAKGHFEVVRLLVENGADIHSSFNGHTALSQAIDYGHSKVVEYLRSVGARE